MNFYAEQSPRGFGNETNTYRFSTRALRDAWVENHKYDGDQNSAALGARAITCKKAYSNVAYKGDACTNSFNSSFINGDELLAASARYDARVEELLASGDDNLAMNARDIACWEIFG